MTDKNELLALADRAEAATGPDRELDALIASIARIGTEHEWAYKYPTWVASKDGRVHLEKNGPSFAAAPYTRSLDAAMTLVPEGWGWLVSQPNAKAIASGLLKERTPVMGEVQYGIDHRYTVAAATPSLSLCAAALRARAAQ